MRTVARLIAVSSVTALAVGLVVAPPARAAQAKPLKPGVWTRISTGPIVSTGRPNLVRFGSKVHVVWWQRDNYQHESVRTRAIGLDGKAEPTRTVVQGWSSVADDPAPFVSKGKLFVAFGGIRTTSPTEKYSGAMAYATSTNGVSYTLAPDALTQTKYAYGSYGTAALDDRGTPFVAVVASSSSHVTWHRGHDGSFPAAAADKTTSDSGGCCAYDTALARDTKTGLIYTAWYSNSSTKPGIWVQKIYPGARGPLLKAPGSTTGGNSVDPSQNVAMVARPGGGVYLAYAVGYPTPGKVRIWKVGTKSYKDVRTPGVKRVALTQGTGGRLWMAWSDGSHKVVGHRSNPKATRWAAGSSIKIPGLSSYPYVYALAANGTRGPLEVVISTDIPGSNPGLAVYASQIWSPLELKLSKKTVSAAKGGTIVLTVRSAGVPVRNARVVMAGKSWRTSSTGKVTIKIKKGAKKGKRKVTVSLRFYVTKSISFKVT